VDKSLTSIIVFGAAGRMGARICALAMEAGEFEVRACVVREGAPTAGAPMTIGQWTGPALQSPKNLGKTAVFADVVVDFSSDDGVHESLAIAERSRSALLVGTTALSAPSLTELRRAASARAVLVAPNTSLGVAALSVLVAQACRTLGKGYACSIVEAHHSAKKDAPSGTAIRLAKSARDAGADLRDDQILSIRGGDVIGEHTVRLAGPGEYIELTHRATTRDLFARGALRCAAWLKGKPPGWYTMNDVLSLPA